MADASDFDEFVATLELDDSLREHSASETLRTGHFGRSGQHLPLLATRPSTTSLADLELGDVIGEGGMGRVLAAVQHPLAREVAVKTTREGELEGARIRILNEAYVTGRLEHPNIVPVHMLGANETGEPLIVMKRIEGVPWSDLLQDPSKAPGDDEPDLIYNLGILLQVCNALRFAHVRDVLHRDIKPENILIGEFGEVYLVDWGIALYCGPDDDTSLPHKSEARGLAGTPAYMAPEMTNSDARDVDERSDVYLLGTTLHELLTGSHRHSGDSLFQVLHAAYESKPFAYGPEVPEALAALANRATAKARVDRPQSVEEFSDEVARFLDTRPSREIAAEANSRLVALRHALEVPDFDAATANSLFIEARFGFRNALAGWSENDVARAGLRETLEVMFDHVVERGDAVMAEEIARELGSDAEARVRALRQEIDHRREELENLKQLRHEQDMAVGTHLRFWFFILLATFWSLASAYRAYDRWGTPIEELRLDHIEATFVTVGVPLLLAILFRKLIVTNRVNRRLYYVFLVTLFSVGSMRFVASQLGLSVVVSTAFEFVLYGAMAAAVGLMTDLRTTYASSIIFVGAILGSMFPEYQMAFFTAVTVAFFGWMAWVWRPISNQGSEL